MTYAGTNKGGTSAIVAAERLIHERRQANAEAGIDLDLDVVIASLGKTIDRIMGEAGLWDRHTAARAFLQASGDIGEAVHILRAHRTTLAQFTTSLPLEGEDLQVVRRIVPAARAPEGPQLLGESVDYSVRILHHDPLTPPIPLFDEDDGTATEPPADEPIPTYSSWLRRRDMLVERRTGDDPEPIDLTRTPPTLPAPRSALLAAMAVAETGGLISLWYRSILGPDGYADESVTLGDVRHGHTPVRVTHPHTGQPVEIGEIDVTTTECFAHLDERGEDTSRFDMGFGFALGHNERKAISMANLDLGSLRAHGTAEGAQLQQVILHTTDGLASHGFLEHLKMPHFVTFRSMLDRAQASASEAAPAQQEVHA